MPVLELPVLDGVGVGVPVGDDEVFVEVDEGTVVVKPTVTF